MIIFLIVAGSIVYLCLGLILLGVVTEMFSSVIYDSDDDILTFFIIFCWPLIILIALLIAFVFASAIKLMFLGKKIAEKIKESWK